MFRLPLFVEIAEEVLFRRVVVAEAPMATLVEIERLQGVTTPEVVTGVIEQD